jgi:murein DD-endopeptidase MepM/ murein hydrolase activator NlpD
MLRNYLEKEHPTPFRRIILLLILSLCSGYYLLQKAENKDQHPAALALMTVSPIVPQFHFDPAPPVVNTQTIEIGKNQTFSEVMQTTGIDAATVQDIYSAAKEVYDLRRIQTGQTMTVVSQDATDFKRLEYSIDPLKTLVVTDQEGALKVELNERTVETSVEEIGGTIQGSLYASLSQLGEKDDLVVDFADIFEWDVDFFTDLQEGDTFRIIYEKKYVEGQTYGYGEILAAELDNKGHLYQAIGYKRNGRMEYFSPDGKAMKKAFLAAPLKFSRISSGFTKSRYHPILKRSRPHYGIDYAAPVGTPVRTIGNGRVISAGWAGGAGKMIKIQHDKEISTIYCHLSRFASGIRPGTNVSQGDVIGYVGATGLATGPHLDFRFLKNGQYINFLSLKSPQAQPLSSAEVRAFQTASAELIKRLGDVKIQQPSKLASVTSSAANFRIL